MRASGVIYLVPPKTLTLDQVLVYVNSRRSRAGALASGSYDMSFPFVTPKNVAGVKIDKGDDPPPGHIDDIFFDPL